jgi:hypothetical protein
MLMRRFFYLFLGFLSAILVVYMTLPIFASDFDKFAKATIREFGHNSDPQLVTDAVLQYLEDNKIDDPIAFLTENMETTYVIDADNPNLYDNQKEIFASGEVTRSSSFSSKYFSRVLTNYELRVRVRDFRSGERRIHARIYLNAP